MRYGLKVRLCVAGLVALSGTLVSSRAAEYWQRHVIDDSSRGADGTRLMDVNGDGLPDIATGWEEGGAVRVYLNPGPAKAKQKWPAVTVGSAKNVEDAVFADLDGDGAVDVVSSCEGGTQSMFVHWAPKAEDYLTTEAWQTEAIPASVKAMRWMFCESLNIDGRNGIDLVAAGKGTGSQIGWWQSPEDPRKLADWQWHAWRPMGWVMSIEAADMDGDGDKDILASDRKGARSAAFWLENPGQENFSGKWKEHLIGAKGKEVMFLHRADLDGDGLEDVIGAVRPRQIVWFRRTSADGRQWEEHYLGLPDESGGAKAVNVGDVNLDGKLDIVFTCEGANGKLLGAMWLEYDQSPKEPMWKAHAISNPDGVKHDLVPMLDLDGDGDQDVITCEERTNLGVIWFENPTR